MDERCLRPQQRYQRLVQVVLEICIFLATVFCCLVDRIWNDDIADGNFDHADCEVPALLRPSNHPHVLYPLGHCGRPLHRCQLRSC